MRRISQNPSTGNILSDTFPILQSFRRKGLPASTQLLFLYSATCAVSRQAALALQCLILEPKLSSILHLPALFKDIIAARTRPYMRTIPVEP